MLNPIDCMRNFCSAAIPAVYDSSLTFYEVLAKLQYKLNEAIASINQNEADIKALNKSVTGNEDSGELHSAANYVIFGVDGDGGTPMMEFGLQTYTADNINTKISNDNKGNRTLVEKLNDMRNDITANENTIAANTQNIAANANNIKSLFRTDANFSAAIINLSSILANDSITNVDDKRYAYANVLYANNKISATTATTSRVINLSNYTANGIVTLCNGVNSELNYAKANTKALNKSVSGNEVSSDLSVQTNEWVVDGSTGNLSSIADTITSAYDGFNQVNSSLSQIANRVNHLLDNKTFDVLSWNNFERGVMALVPQDIPVGFGFTAENISKYLSNLGANVPVENISVFNFGTYASVQSLCGGAASFLQNDPDAKLKKGSISTLYVFGTGAQDADTSTTVSQLKAQLPEDCSIVLLPDGWFNVPTQNYALSYNALGANVVSGGYEYLVGTDVKYAGIVNQTPWIMMDLMFTGMSNRHTEYAYYFDNGSSEELKAKMFIDGKTRRLCGFSSTMRGINEGDLITPFYGNYTSTYEGFYFTPLTSCWSSTPTYTKTDNTGCGQMYLSGDIGGMTAHYNPPNIGEYSLYDLTFDIYLTAHMD